MTIGNRLKKLRKLRKRTQEQIANELGLTRIRYAQYEIDRREPDFDTLKKIADYFDVSYDYLLGGEGVDKRIDRLRKLQDKYLEAKNELEALELLENAGAQHIIDFIKIPVLGNIAAGIPILANENIIDWEYLPNDCNFKDGDVFCLFVKGDSMIGSRIFDGDKIIVRVQQDVEDGEIAVVNVDGENATLKRVKKTKNGGIILYPDNPKYDPIIINSENARICGKVLRVVFDPNSKL